MRIASSSDADGIRSATSDVALGERAEQRGAVPVLGQEIRQRAASPGPLQRLERRALGLHLGEASAGRGRGLGRPASRGDALGHGGGRAGRPVSRARHGRGTRVRRPVRGGRRCGLGSAGIQCSQCRGGGRNRRSDQTQLAVDGRGRPGVLQREELLDQRVVPRTLPEPGGVRRGAARQVHHREGAERANGRLGVRHRADPEVVRLRQHGQGLAHGARRRRCSGAPTEVGDGNGHGGGHVVRLAFAFPGRHEGVGWNQ